MFPSFSPHNTFRKIDQGRNTVFDRHLCRIFLENLVQGHNAKKKNNDSRSYTNSKKIP